MSNCADALALPPPPLIPRRLIMVAAAVLVNDQGAVLITERLAHKDFPGTWEFPGGKIERGETPSYALMRELREELGIETRPTCFWPLGFITYDMVKNNEDVCFVVMCYVCRVWTGTVTGCEGQNVKWVKPKQLYNHPIIPSNLPLIPQVIDRI